MYGLTDQELYDMHVEEGLCPILFDDPIHTFAQAKLDFPDKNYTVEGFFCMEPAGHEGEHRDIFIGLYELGCPVCGPRGDAWGDED